MIKEHVKKVILETAKEAEGLSDGMIRVLEPPRPARDPKEVVLETMKQTYSVFVNLPEDFHKGAYPSRDQEKMMKKKE